MKGLIKVSTIEKKIDLKRKHFKEKKKIDINYIFKKINKKKLLFNKMFPFCDIRYPHPN